MTAISQNRSPRRRRNSYWSRQWSQLKQATRQFFVRGDFTALLIALGLILMVMFSLRAADWPLELGVVLPVSLLSVLFGFLLARSSYGELLALMMSMVYGACFVLLSAALSEPGGLVTGVFSVFLRSVGWLIDAVNGGINQDELVFSMLVGTLFWFLGYNVAWHIFRVDRVMRVILPPALLIVINSVYYSGDNNLTPYLTVFTFLCLLLVVRSNLDAREWEWYTSGLRVPSRVRRQFNTVGAVLALVTVGLGWAVPSTDLQTRLDNFQEFMQADPFSELSELWNRLFSPIDAYGPVTADYYGGDSLELSGAIRLGDQMVMRVEAPFGRRYYWRSRVFDTYQDGNWTSQAIKRVPYVDARFVVGQSPDTLAGREPVQQTYTILMNASRLVYTAPQPASIELPVRVDARFLDAAETQMNLYVTRPLRILERGESYTATSTMSTATATELRASGTDYPQWVLQTQLYVPPTVTGRTLALGQQIVEEAGAVTAYDRAKAIERWLRENISYNESIPQPPAGQDPIDWVLFDLREGYCNYYASAMIMMLRAQGIPARMGAGFAQGEWDGSGYLVRERDAHTWVEVYFPGYGWVEFEPTAAQQPLDRGDENAPVPPTSTPAFTPTPTFTPSPTATTTPSPTPLGTMPPPESESLTLPTSTPTFTPSPTATPMIIPTQPPPLTPPPPTPLSFLLPAIFAALVGLLVVVVIVLIGVFVWWWWEWRGMRGLSPVTRAYARLERYVTGLLSVPLRDEETPLERRDHILSELPRRASRPVSMITQMYTEERYGARNPQDEQVTSGSEKAWQRTRENILLRWVRRRIPLARFFIKE